MYLDKQFLLTQISLFFLLYKPTCINVCKYCKKNCVLFRSRYLFLHFNILYFLFQFTYYVVKNINMNNYF